MSGKKVWRRIRVNERKNEEEDEEERISFLCTRDKNHEWQKQYLLISSLLSLHVCGWNGAKFCSSHFLILLSMVVQGVVFFRAKKGITKRCWTRGGWERRIIEHSRKKRVRERQSLTMNEAAEQVNRVCLSWCNDETKEREREASQEWKEMQCMMKGSSSLLDSNSWLERWWWWKHGGQQHDILGSLFPLPLLPLQRNFLTSLLMSE